MTDMCHRGFRQDLLSGYLDGELTQGDEQWVRVHVEGCDECRDVLVGLGQLREVAMKTEFTQPGDQQWRETPRTTVSRAARGAGWMVLIVWVLATVGFALWQVATSPEGLLPKLLAFGGISGVALLLLSVLVDRVRDLRTDRYRGVER